MRDVQKPENAIKLYYAFVFDFTRLHPSERETVDEIVGVKYI